MAQRVGETHEEYLARRKKWRLKNRKRLAALAREWYRSGGAEISKAWAAKNREKINQRARARLLFDLQFQARRRAHSQAWRDANKQRAREACARSKRKRRPHILVNDVRRILKAVTEGKITKSEAKMKLAALTK